MNYVVRSPQKNKSIANGMTNLSLRPSPRPQDRVEDKQLLNVMKKGSGPNDAIDLISDSEDMMSKRNNRRPRLTDRKASESPSHQDEPYNLEDWMQPETKPIRFDPENSGSLKAGLDPTAASSGTRSSSPTKVTRLTSHIPSQEPALVNGASSNSPRSRSSQKPIQVLVPPTPAQHDAKRKDIVRRLKADVAYIKTHPYEVAAATGVAPFDNTDLDEDISRKARQKKHKKVDRQAITLDTNTYLSSLIKSEECPQMEMVHPRKQARRILTERFKQAYIAPLSFENRRNERYIHGKFQFISEHIPNKKVNSKKPIPLPSHACQCQDGCEAGCSCTTPREMVNGKIMQSETSFTPYQRLSDDLIVLSSGFLDTWSDKLRVLFECTEGCICSCSNSCKNRVVQKGRTVPLQIFETAHCGFGVRTLVNLARGQFIDVYLGEVLTSRELEKREDAAEEYTPSYLMSLDVFAAQESCLHIDGANFGSVTRFVNHSCEPNAKTIPVVGDGSSKNIYQVAFFAIKDIPAGTEITIDYNPDLELTEDEITDSAIVQCRCGSAKCRKRLWKPGKEKRARKRVLHGRDDD